MMLFFGLLLKCLPHRTCFLLQVIYLTQLLLSQSAQVIYLFIVICFCFWVKLEFTPKSKFLFTWNLILLLLQNPNVLICTPNFTIGSSRSCNFVLKDQTISANLCKIKHTQVHTSQGVCDCAWNGRVRFFFLCSEHTPWHYDFFTGLLFEMWMNAWVKVCAWLASFLFLFSFLYSCLR